MDGSRDNMFNNFQGKETYFVRTTNRRLVPAHRTEANNTHVGQFMPIFDVNPHVHGHPNNHVNQVVNPSSQFLPTSNQYQGFQRMSSDVSYSYQESNMHGPVPLSHPYHQHSVPMRNVGAVPLQPAPQHYFQPTPFSNGLPPLRNATPMFDPRQANFPDAHPAQIYNQHQLNAPVDARVTQAFVMRRSEGMFSQSVVGSGSQQYFAPEIPEPRYQLRDTYDYQQSYSRSNLQGITENQNYQSIRTNERQELQMIGHFQPVDLSTGYSSLPNPNTTNFSSNNFNMNYDSSPPRMQFHPVPIDTNQQLSALNYSRSILQSNLETRPRNLDYSSSNPSTVNMQTLQTCSSTSTSNYCIKSSDRHFNSRMDYNPTGQLIGFQQPNVPMPNNYNNQTSYNAEVGRGYHFQHSSSNPNTRVACIKPRSSLSQSFANPMTNQEMYSVQPNNLPGTRNRTIRQKATRTVQNPLPTSFSDSTQEQVSRGKTSRKHPANRKRNTLVQRQNIKALRPIIPTNANQTPVSTSGGGNENRSDSENELVIDSSAENEDDEIGSLNFTEQRQIEVITLSPSPTTEDCQDIQNEPEATSETGTGNPEETPSEPEMEETIETVSQVETPLMVPETPANSTSRHTRLAGHAVNTFIGAYVGFTEWYRNMRSGTDILQPSHSLTPFVTTSLLENFFENIASPPSNASPETHSRAIEQSTTISTIQNLDIPTRISAPSPTHSVSPSTSSSCSSADVFTPCPSPEGSVVPSSKISSPCRSPDAPDVSPCPSPGGLDVPPSISTLCISPDVPPSTSIGTPAPNTKNSEDSIPIITLDDSDDEHDSEVEVDGQRLSENETENNGDAHSQPSTEPERTEPIPVTSLTDSNHSNASAETERIYLSSSSLSS